MNNGRASTWIKKIEQLIAENNLDITTYKYRSKMISSSAVISLLTRVKTNNSKVYASNAQFFRAKNVVQSQ